jgi:NAD(P)-dependent dehydrogenase (short-subunit alcohol dehydrogenase family)
VWSAGGVYGATEHAVETLGGALRFEFGHFGVRVTHIEPGSVATGLRAASLAAAEAPPDYRELAEQL